MAKFKGDLWVKFFFSPWRVMGAWNPLVRVVVGADSMVCFKRLLNRHMDRKWRDMDHSQADVISLLWHPVLHRR